MTHPNENATPPTTPVARPDRSLLVPLDGSDFSRRILGQVRSLFAPRLYRIALLHVADPPPNLARPYRPAAVGLDYTLYAYDLGHRPAAQPSGEELQRHAIYEGAVDEAYRQRLERDLEAEMTLFASAGYDATATVHFGDPVAEIVAFAEAEPVDAIAMATHARSGLGRLFYGSVAQDVLDRVRIPVLLLRADEDDEDGEGDGETSGLPASAPPLRSESPKKGAIR